MRRLDAGLPVFIESWKNNSNSRYFLLEWRRYRWV
jgi:hypothetical protein